MSYDRLPPGLKEETTFCLYKLEPGKDGKKKKVPYQTCGARADPGNKAHLTDFTTAYVTYCNGGYDGIGLSVAEDMADAPASAGAFSINLTCKNVYDDIN